MKKCPYCAEEIQDAAIVCRYCQRELVPNLEEVVQSRIKQQWEEGITLEDLYKISEKWANSYATVKWVMKVHEFAGSITNELMSPIFDLYLDHRISDEKSVKQGIGVCLANVELWAIMCFSIGVEHGLNNIDLNTNFKLSLAISEPILIFLANFLSGLRKKGVITLEQSTAQSKFIVTTITTKAIQLSEMGRMDCQLAGRKARDFLDALLGLSLPGEYSINSH